VPTIVVHRLSALKTNPIAPLCACGCGLVVPKLHKDWEPERARLESLEAIRDHKLISKWGAIHNPESRDMLIPPYV